MFVRNLQIAEALQVARKSGVKESIFCSLEYLLARCSYRFLPASLVCVLSAECLIYLQMPPSAKRRYIYARRT